MTYMHISRFRIHSTSSEIFPCSFTTTLEDFLQIYLHAYKQKLINKKLFKEFNIDTIEGLEVLYGVLEHYLGCNYVVDSLNTNGLLISQLEIQETINLCHSNSLFFKNRRSVMNYPGIISHYATGLAFAIKYETMPHSDLDFCCNRLVFCVIPFSETNSGKFNQSLIYAVNNNLPILYIVLKNHEESYIGPYYMQECYSRYTFVHSCQVYQEDVFSLMYAFELVIKVVKRKGPVILQLDCRYKNMSKFWGKNENPVDRMEEIFKHKSVYHLLIDPKEKLEMEVINAFKKITTNEK